MTIALDRPAQTSSAHLNRTSSARHLQRVGAPSSPQPSAEEGVTMSESVTLHPVTGDVEAALLADELRTHAQRQATTRQGRTSVSVSSPNSFSAGGSGLRALPPRGQGAAAVSPLRPRRSGVVSANSTARRDEEAERRRDLLATAVSPSRPSVAAVTALDDDLQRRRVRNGVQVRTQ